MANTSTEAFPKPRATEAFPPPLVPLRPTEEEFRPSVIARPNRHRLPPVPVQLSATSN